MAEHSFNETVPDLPGSHDSAALGASTAAPLNKNDLGKFVKLAGSENYVLAAEGNDIEGQLATVEPDTVNDGWAFGAVQVRFKTLLVRHQAGESAIAVGATVVVGTPVAINTALGTAKYPAVKAGAGVLFKWRVKSLMGGAGAAGTVLLIEPITR